MKSFVSQVLLVCCFATCTSYGLHAPCLHTFVAPHAALRASPKYPYATTRSPVAKSIGISRGYFDDNDFALTLSKNEESKRLSFIRKVYGLFSGQVAATVLSTLYIRNNAAIQQLLFSNFQAISTASFLGSFAILNAFAWNPRLRYNAPMNYVLLALYTGFQSAFIGSVASAFAPHIALTAALHTLTAFSALTFLAFTLRSSADLSPKRGLLVTLLASLSCGSILNMLFGTPLLHSILSSLSAALLSLFMIADTQAIISGSHMYGYGTRDHILASMSLYQHATSLFMRILDLVASQKQRKRKYNSW